MYLSTNVYASGDCVDSDGVINPRTVRYADSDGDGYGDINTSIKTCNQPANYVLNHSDCDDTNDAIKPGATEICDGVDNNCNDTVDEGYSAVCS